MKFHSLRSLLVLLLALVSAGLLSSCGGGGANGTGNPPTGGLVRIVPEVGTIYAGIPFTFQMIGGRPPYTLSSSEPNLLPLPARVSGHSVTVVANNPGVIDADLKPEDLPVRTVTVSVRDATGDFRNSELQVAQNFLTGYGIVITPTTCVTGGQACAGGESAVRMQATFGGNLFGNQSFRFEVVRGNFSLRNPLTGQLAQAITLNSDHTGTITGPFIVVPPGVPTQLAVLRVIHVPTGVYADHIFTISQTAATANQLTVIPDTFNFKGALKGQCGTGVADFFVFDGVPPYTAVSNNTAIQVTPTVSNSQPGRFSVVANRQDACVNATIVVTDSLGARDTVTVTTVEGDATPPTPPEPPDLTVGPSSITLGCGQSGSVSVVGGTGIYSVNSTNSNVTATVGGNTLTITRAGPVGPGAGTLTAGISVTDGSQIATVTVTAPATCP